MTSCPHLEQKLVFGETLDWFQQVGIQAQLVLQLSLTLLHTETKLITKLHAMCVNDKSQQGSHLLRG